ncbi:hypothetical protein GFK26_18200 [Variovorax paradoxus]|uniref:Uncharacterized protein n=1 Tax=Variovorax paradoxus TaxID=34073 RepID=A0A5Q0M4L2_VARPD|nr:hypothetical protein [Variovorax paradoxus]QFZ84561.1 hypothetical protein GFK26_18200 [Variovorax paradoxus]
MTETIPNDLNAIRARAAAFAAEHVVALAREVSAWQDTGLLVDGRMRELAAIVAPIAGDHKMQMAESFADRAARSAVLAASSLPDLPKPFRVEQPQNHEPFGLFTGKQMIEYRLSKPKSGREGH